MNRIRSIARLSALLGVALALAGCESNDPGRVTDGKGQVIERSQPRIVSLGFDSRDYDTIVAWVCESLAKAATNMQEKVVAMGPVVIAPDEQQNMKFNSVTLHERLATKAQRQGTFRFSEIVRASKVVRTDEAADTVVEKIRQGIKALEYHTANTDDPEEYALYGGLAKVNYMMVFRLSSKVQTGKKDYREVTYRVNLKLVGTTTGLRIWTDEFEWTKAK